jgi:hypothetical protein
MGSNDEYVYALIDPDTEQVRYVGRSYSPAERLRGHLTNARTNPTSAKDEWIAELLAAGKRPIMEVLEEAKRGYDSAGFAERDWMRRLLADGQPLLNVRYPKGRDGESESDERG